MAMVQEAVEQCAGHRCVAENVAPIAKVIEAALHLNNQEYAVTNALGADIAAKT